MLNEQERKERALRAIDRRDFGWTYKKIADDLCVSITVAKKICEMGIHLRDMRRNLKSDISMKTYSVIEKAFSYKYPFPTIPEIRSAFLDGVFDGMTGCGQKTIQEIAILVGCGRKGEELCPHCGQKIKTKKANCPKTSSRSTYPA